MRGGPHALFVYGSLAPGETNAFVLAALRGRWMPARIRGELRRFVRGPERGYLALRTRPERHDVWVRGQVLMSSQLAANWARIDRFEGPHYARQRVLVWSEGLNGDRAQARPVRVQTYVLHAPLAWTTRADAD